MAETRIEWTATRLADGTTLPGYTFNPWEGCQKVGPGCDHCYAEARDFRFTGGVHWGPHSPRRLTSAANWRKPLAWNKRAAAAGIRRNVFCASLADVFDNHATILPSWRIELGQMILATPHLNWMLLTKRIGNAEAMLAVMFPDGPPPNLWIGATVVNQAEADRDIPKLLALPVAVRFLSMEPLLGPVDLTKLDMLNIFRVIRSVDDQNFPRHHYDALRGQSDIHPIHGAEPNWGRLHWIICGGESGPGARPMHPDWARSLRDQCQAAGVAFHFKQWGEWGHALDVPGVTAISAAPPKNGNWAHPHRYRIHGGPEDGQCFVSLPQDHHMLRVGKHAAGRLLDGREHNDMPGVMG